MTITRRFTLRERTALFILREAQRLDLRVGTDGCDLILAPPKGMPRDSYFSFQRAIIAHRNEVITLIMDGVR
jgi:hypothetical protein